jgi:hypothetical protein
MNRDIFFGGISWMFQDIAWIWYDVGTKTLVVIETRVVRLATL